MGFVEVGFLRSVVSSKARLRMFSFMSFFNRYGFRFDEMVGVDFVDSLAVIQTFSNGRPILFGFAMWAVFREVVQKTIFAINSRLTHFRSYFASRSHFSVIPEDLPLHLSLHQFFQYFSPSIEVSRHVNCKTSPPQACLYQGSDRS